MTAKRQVTTTQEIVEKAHLTFLTPLSGVVSPFLGKRSSIVDRMVKPLFFASHKEICSEAFSTALSKATDLLPRIYFS